MSEPLSPELELKAQELAARIHCRSADSILDMARRLVSTTEATLFGATEFALRDLALGVVADAYAEHLPQKVATTVRPSTAPIAARPPASTTTAPKPSRASAARSRVAGPITIAAVAVEAPAPGTPASD